MKKTSALATSLAVAIALSLQFGLSKAYAASHKKVDCAAGDDGTSGRQEGRRSRQGHEDLQEQCLYAAARKRRRQPWRAQGRWPVRRRWPVPRAMASPAAMAQSGGGSRCALGFGRGRSQSLSCSSKQRPPRASRAAGDVSLNSAGPQPLRAGFVKRPPDLSLTLSLDKREGQKGSSRLCKLSLGTRRVAVRKADANSS